MAEASPPTTIRSVSRALALIRCFAPGVDSLTLQELASEAEVPKSTAVRILGALRAEGMIDHDPFTRTYSPGVGFLHWAQVAGHRWGVPTAVTDLMHSAVSKFGESISLYVRSGDSRIAIAHVPGTQTLRHVIAVGESMTLSAGSSSWILLQNAPPEIVERVERSLRDRGAGYTAKEKIERSTRLGYSSSRGEREAGVAGVSVRVDLPHGRPVGALTFGGPTARIGKTEITEYAQHLQTIAPTIGAQLDTRRYSSATHVS
ncbi:IclR family transcriptional regulator [Brevibacterium marinum]|uniref:DNA-binding IclR family transcriptional regulator n=1 Tax=Brevibacterium marinum TaxID=418643 RepID=A0A846S487_9MICO|nr:IclR family transcriptional regulator [Brevibacterium marinum]NJC56322.1 DNA-binding IclR family transcriptional regulator [Brevibacterium marinum]